MEALFVLQYSTPTGSGGKGGTSVQGTCDPYRIVNPKALGVIDENEPYDLDIFVGATCFIAEVERSDLDAVKICGPYRIVNAKALGVIDEGESNMILASSLVQLASLQKLYNLAGLKTACSQPYGCPFFDHQPIPAGSHVP